MVDFVSAEGNTFDTTSKLIVAPDSFDSLATLFNGASTTGNLAIAVKTSDIDKGVLMVKLTPFAEPVFVAVK